MSLSVTVPRRNSTSPSVENRLSILATTSLADPVSCAICSCVILISRLPVLSYSERRKDARRRSKPVNRICCKVKMAEFKRAESDSYK